MSPLLIILGEHRCGAINIYGETYEEEEDRPVLGPGWKTEAGKRD